MPCGISGNFVRIREKEAENAIAREIEDKSVIAKHY
jgi:hypothetical protein